MSNQLLIPLLLRQNPVECAVLKSTDLKIDKRLIMLTIRLARTGAKKRPFYHVVAADSRSPRDGRFVERLGYFNPVARGKELRLNLNLDKINDWKAKGAQISDRVTSLIKEAESPSKKRPAKKKKKPVVEAKAEEAPAEAAAEAKPAE
jgi:small subunit ribosomal protein S16